VKAGRGLALEDPVAETRRKRPHPLIYAAMFIDTLGGGLIAPFELVYAHVVVGLRLPTAGAALAAAAAAGIAVGPITGVAVDRVGAMALVAAANLLGVLGCIALILARGVALFAIGSLFIMAGMRTFWGAFTPLVAELAPPQSLDAWFGRIRGARFVGIATGEALAGVFLLAGERAGLISIVAVDGGSYLVAMTLILAASRGRAPRVRAARELPVRRGYRAALSDRANLLLAGLNVADTVLIEAPVLAMPVFVLDQLHLDRWLPGVLAAITTVVVAAGTMFGSGLLRGRRRLRNMQFATWTWTAAFAMFLAVPWTRGGELPLLVGAMALLGLGEAFYAPTADALPAALAPPGLLGRYAAVHQMAWGISETVSPLVAGALLAVGVSATWILLTALGVLAAVAYRVLERSIGDRDGTVPRRERPRGAR
jgi:MFS family permease